MKPSLIENQITLLLLKGEVPSKELDVVNQAIDLFVECTKTHPLSLLNALKDAAERRIDGMILIGLAILTCQAEDTFIQEQSSQIISLLSLFGPPKLLEYVDYLKSKVFGKGFGSRPQKWVRRIMEGWTIQELNKHSAHPDFRNLIRLVHPRYNGKRGELIRQNWS